jgi:hypothetical protein
MTKTIGGLNVAGTVFNWTVIGYPSVNSGFGTGPSGRTVHLRRHRGVCNANFSVDILDTQIDSRATGTQ